MISPVQFTPNMDMNSLTAALNDFTRQVESENRTKVIRDEDGQNRIIMGRFPDGKYGFAVTIPGADVLEEIRK